MSSHIMRRKCNVHSHVHSHIMRRKCNVACDMRKDACIAFPTHDMGMDGFIVLFAYGMRMDELTASADDESVKVLEVFAFLLLH